MFLIVFRENTASRSFSSVTRPLLQDVKLKLLISRGEKNASSHSTVELYASRDSFYLISSHRSPILDCVSKLYLVCITVQFRIFR